MQTKERRVRLVKFASSKTEEDWKPKPLIWAALVLALTGSKMAGSKLYSQVSRENAKDRTRMLEAMASGIVNSKCSDLSDVCEDWRLLYDDAITR